jgi:hypothetical protein
MKKIVLFFLLLTSPLIASELEDNWCRYFYLELEPGMQNYELIDDINAKYGLQMDAIDPGGIFIGYCKNEIISRGITPENLKRKYRGVACVRDVYDAECSVSNGGKIRWHIFGLKAKRNKRP